MPGRLYPSAQRRTGVRKRAPALHQPGGVYRLRSVCSRLPCDRDFRSRRSAGKVAELHANQRRLVHKTGIVRCTAEFIARRRSLNAPPFLFWLGAPTPYIFHRGEASKIGAAVLKQFGSEFTI